MDQQNNPTLLEGCRFVNPMGVFGDQNKRYQTNAQERQAFADKSEDVNPEYNGFLFDSSQLTQQLLDIEKVKSRYLPLLESGCVDLDSAYPEFIQQLYEAGLQQVMDEKQCQFDAWLMDNPS